MTKMVGSPADSWGRLRRQLARVEPPFDASDTLPPPCYTDPDIFERELETICHASFRLSRADRRTVANRQRWYTRTPSIL